MLMVMPHDKRNLVAKGQISICPDHCLALSAVRLHYQPFLRIERTRLAQDRIRELKLANIMKMRGQGEYSKIMARKVDSTSEPDRKRSDTIAMGRGGCITHTERPGKNGIDCGSPVVHGDELSMVRPSGRKARKMRSLSQNRLRTAIPLPGRTHVHSLAICTPRGVQG